MNDSLNSWSCADSTELYGVDRWGKGYFVVGEDGSLEVRPSRESVHSINLREVIGQVRARGLDLPILLRLNGLLEDRIRRLHEAFQDPIDDNGYKGKYCCVYPIKVNQQRSVVQKVLEYGRPLGLGLEAGSKAELMAVVAMADHATPIICNGFKDDEFVEMALRATQIGRQVIVVVEKYTELELIIRHANRIGVRPQIGIRVKLAASGSGHWQAAGGYRSKFGLSVTEVLRGWELLKSCDMANCFQLLHFHLGSQITDIHTLSEAINEATRMYAGLVGCGAELKYLDVGGGLGVDYTGSQAQSESSMNYTVEEYARAVVFHISTVCREAGVLEPDIITESGRAIVAFHDVLIFEALGVSGQGGQGELPRHVPDECEQPLQTLAMTLRNTCPQNFKEAFHDAQQALEAAMNLFSGGHLSLEQRAAAEEYYIAICHKVRAFATQLKIFTEETTQLDQLLSDTYLCNFSVFRSMPDSWAISQLFPIVPMHRLHERPDRNAVLADITCDSDGKIASFIRRGSVLRLHSQNDQPYYLGAFLVGAYQEILGSLHNLFGGTNMVHVDLHADGRVTLGTVTKGEAIHEVLDQVEYERSDLVERLHGAVDIAVNDGLIDQSLRSEVVQAFDECLDGYTYPEKEQVQ